MDHLLEILKYTIPALIVFLSVYYIFRSFLNQQYQMEALKFRQSQNKDAFPLKLQAYERLMMFCERISIENLAYRLVHPDMGVSELRNSMLIATQQEYEHNVTQQVYVSENLWKIVQMAKDQIQSVISDSEGTTTAEFLSNTRQNMTKANADPITVAKAAIRNEASLLI